MLVPVGRGDFEAVPSFELPPRDVVTFGLLDTRDVVDDVAVVAVKSRREILCSDHNEDFSCHLELPS